MKHKYIVTSYYNKKVIGSIAENKLRGKIFLSTKEILLFVIISLNIIAQSNHEQSYLSTSSDRYPVVSPDGNTIYFSSNRDGDYDIYKYDRTTEKTHKIIDLPGDESHPDISPDANYITFYATVGDVHNNKQEIYIAKSDGSDIRRITNHAHSTIHPKFHPDGKSILYNRQVDSGEDNYEFYLVNIESGEHRKLFGDERNITFASYSPDGNKIAFVKWFENMNTEIFIADSDGSNQKNISNHELFDGWPCWSHDGTQIYFASDRDKKFHFTLYSYELKSSKVSPVTTDELQYVQPSVGENGIVASCYADRNLGATVVFLPNDQI